MTRPRLDSEGRRRAIVETAMPLFARQGFAGTTTKEIARAAGVSEALVFQHFPSKAALYGEILQCGCEGEPALERLFSLEPSTATLVEMVQFLLRYEVLNEFCTADEAETRHRLHLHSYLEDGVYAAATEEWVQEHVFPLFAASFRAAEGEGDLRPGRLTALQAFIFADHVATMTAYKRLPPRASSAALLAPAEDVDAAALFILRGFGLSDMAIARHIRPTVVVDRLAAEPAA